MTGNAAVWFVDRHVAEGRADKPAFIEAAGLQRTLTYGELADHSDRAAGAFAKLGVRREERAVLFVLDQIELPVLFWGALKAGVVPVPVNTLLSTEIYTAILADSRASVAFVSVELLPVVAPALDATPSVRHIVVIGDEIPPQHLSYDQFMKDAEPHPAVTCKPDEIAFWLYSSGSTGAPKGVRHVHSALRETCDTYAKQVLQIRETDTVYSAAKLFFAYGLGNAMSFPMAVGATAILYNGRPTPETVTEILTTHRPTIYCGVPTLYAALLSHWEQSGEIPEVPLRICVSAGEALPAEIGERWTDLFGIEILDGVGSTEMLHIFLSNAPGDVVYGTSGTPVPGYAVRLVDDLGAEVAQGEVGELLVKGGSAAADYWNQRDKSRTTFEGEWTRTGDKYERRPDGRFIYCGRTDDMFKVSGIWVSPFEVEQALIAYPGILEAAVVAHRDDQGLEKPKAFIVLKPGTEFNTFDELNEFVKTRIGKWKYPRWIEVVDDLPKTATGKIQRFKLRNAG